MKDPRDFRCYDDSPLNDGWNYRDPDDDPYFGKEYIHEDDEDIPVEEEDTFYENDEDDRLQKQT